ncbi:hypothetical protein OG552_10170 [Streptomyces sp. NBC_01476]|uniref:hypothetical protein n=1 Tax=Streptomyces sp. NBC_01476 TaxID=2903881 RepID=UPI002E2EEC71|nr:hypothetical protein [Streptomyces sp. NBC_01476]
MSAIEIAEARSLTVEDPQSFMLAFHAGRRAAGMDVDTAQFLRSLCTDGHASSAAGFVEGLAAANAEAGIPVSSAAPFWRRNILRTKAVAA